ncbi:unnamed protein product [Cyprideis torosa]|uniref:Uncharacterized protein n=1 Tax=Cyprideis torosa TaxID=163714 RepID=A0A7R8ZPA8_9CRUS|nr:unnamed protein product [Cyprideis torosa]CAG0888023.1 unnamed protein product [Cyprideis torosa]
MQVKGARGGSGRPAAGSRQNSMPIATIGPARVDSPVKSSMPPKQTLPPYNRYFPNPVFANGLPSGVFLSSATTGLPLQMARTEFNAAPPGAQVRHQLPPAQMAYSTQAPWFQYGPQQQAQAFIYVANTNQRWPNPAAAYNPTALYTQPTAIRGTPPAQPPPTPPQVPQAPIPQAEHKRAKNVLRIEDPTTGALLNEDYIAQNASSSIATSTSSGDASGQTATSGAGRPSGGAAPGPGPPSAPHSGMGGPPSSAVPSMHPPSATLANTAFPPPSPAVRMPQSQPSSEASVPQSYDPSSGAPMAPHHGMHPGVPRGPAPMMTTYQAQANSNMGAAGDPTMQNWYVPGYHQRSYLHHQQRMPMMMGGHPPSEKGSHAVKIEAPPPSSSTPRVATPPQQPPQQPPSHPPPPASTGQPTPPPAAPSSTTPAPAPTPAPKQPPTAPAAAPAPSQTTATATPPQVPQKEPEQATESSVGCLPCFVHSNRPAGSGRERVACQCRCSSSAEPIAQQRGVSHDGQLQQNSALDLHSANDGGAALLRDL